MWLSRLWPARHRGDKSALSKIGFGWKEALGRQPQMFQLQQERPSNEGGGRLPASDPKRTDANLEMRGPLSLDGMPIKTIRSDSVAIIYVLKLMGGK
ncbi:MAG: hypothetical protein CVT73_09515 [Alphaproteobacteria bacterium HGW-Alphaproteobacteria-12]|nr:MAG: hypothetical protein CVT73_09515 [Alphaproteobacteria bacterium HGW-Alphaproteobacteria-12]